MTASFFYFISLKILARAEALPAFFASLNEKITDSKNVNLFYPRSLVVIGS
jgi:hypothetical protein